MPKLPNGQLATNDEINPLINRHYNRYMDKSNDSLKNIQKLAKMLDGHQMVTMEEFRSAVSDFINAFAQHRSAFGEISKKNEESMATALKNLQAEFEAIRGEVKTETGMTKEEMKSMMAKCMSDMKDMCDEMESRLPKDGEKRVIQEVLAKIKLPEQKEIILDSPDEVIDKVNLGTKQIKKERVEGLKDLISNIAHSVVQAVPVTTNFFNGLRGKNLVIQGGSATSNGDTVTVTLATSSGGGVNVEEPTGTIDGSNTTFTVTNTPKMAFFDGVAKFETLNYTYSAPTITITDGAPPVLSIRTLY